LTPSKLNAGHNKLVLDASVLINILGTGSPDAVLRAMNRAVLVDEVALREVTIDPFTGKSPDNLLVRLRTNSLIEVISMDADAYNLFIGLTGAEPPDDLDDGEAATLAQAAHKKYVAVIDEKKATRIAGVHYPEVVLLNSLDLLAAPELLRQCGRDGLADIVYHALRNARMRVPSCQQAWIVNLLGDERAQQCSSLSLPPDALVSRQGH
jgi:predicted nucleic acid-binding protein